MDKTEIFSAVRDAIVNKPRMTYKQIAAAHGISASTVQKVAGILKKQTGFSRPLGRPLGSNKSNRKMGHIEKDAPPSVL